MIKNIILITSLLFLFSCNNGMLSSNNKLEVDTINSEEYEYIQLQVKMHKAYTLLKAFNTGAISQEEYDKLKKELI
tara:strand:+ start:2551 stop:2778 length:228 start_codon:yes stop_codon:yes gene_type:complete